MSEHAAEFEVHIAARPETVFSLFVDQAAFAQWMGAQMGVATIEPHVGGAIRVDYGGGWKIAAGEVVELAEPERFAFTWGYEDGQPFGVGETRVEITLSPTATGTRLVLRHSGLPSETAAREHGSGWRLYTGILAHLAAKTAHGGRIDALVAAWFAAWGETDPERRVAHIAACMADDGIYHHPTALTRGHEPLAINIASAQRHMQGLVIEPHGAAEQVHQHVRFPWRVTKDGQTMFTGTNVAVIGMDGRFASVVGFTDG